MQFLCIQIEYSRSFTDEETGVITALLTQAGFEGFEETSRGLKAYIPENLYALQEVNSLMEKLSTEYPLHWNVSTVEDKNWNESWEKNYAPVFIQNRCLVRAPFHVPYPGVELDIVIMPKMSFGTAHHETTQLMIEYILENQWKGKEVLDMGCGTGVLAIIVAKAGASRVLAIDNDPIACTNARENVDRNKVAVQIKQGEIELIQDLQFDAILANINRNVLLDHLSWYAASLRKSGRLYLSGFLSEDLPIIRDAALRSGLKHCTTKSLNHWIAAEFCHE